MPAPTNRPLVLASLENGDGTRCVDIFRRADGSFGFEECRRDPEDPRGWARMDAFGHLVFVTEAEAGLAAEAAVSWLAARKT